MTRQFQKHLSLLLVVLTIATGCHPTQPFYFHEDGDLSHYLDRVTDLESPDVYEPRLAEVDSTYAPLTLSNPEPGEMWDLTLEDAISTTLKNSKVIRNLGAVTQFGFADALIGRTGSSATVYDAAIVESDAQSGVESALAAFDAQLSMLGTNGNGNFLNRTDRPSTFGAGLLVDQTNGGLRTELSKRAATGTQFFLRNITEYTRGNTLLGVNQPLDSLWQTTMEAEIRQPILRDRGTLINRLPVILARINTDVSLASFEASIRNLLFDVENTYWDLHLAYRNLETAKIGRDSAQITWRTVYAKASGGVEGSQAEQQAREQYYFFRAQIETALRDLYNTEGRLRFLMGLTPTDLRLIRPIDEPTTAEVHFDWCAIQEEALIRTAELRQQKWVIQRREFELVAAKNQLLPQFDLGVTYRWFGIGDELINADRRGLNFPQIGSTAADVLTDGSFQEAAFFLQAQMPIGFRRALSGVRNAQLSIAREKSRLEDMELNTVHLLSSTIRNLDANRTVAQTHFERWSAAIEEVETTQALEEGGKISVDIVLDAQRRRAQAQIDYYRALIDYNKNIAEVHFRKGSLLEYDNVQLSEGPWPEKAYWDALGRARERDASYYLDYGWSRPHVFSEGPVAQQWGESGDAVEGEAVEVLESSPEAMPTPAAPQPPTSEELPMPGSPAAPQLRVPGPITNRPGDTPLFNAPLRKADARRSNGGQSAQAASASTPGAFSWSAFESGSAAPSIDNPLRQASYNE
ncbi:MAG: TolC family protein [Pirellulaceae bacterium]